MSGVTQRPVARSGDVDASKESKFYNIEIVVSKRDSVEPVVGFMIPTGRTLVATIPSSEEELKLAIIVHRVDKLARDITVRTTTIVWRHKPVNFVANGESLRETFVPKAGASSSSLKKEEKEWFLYDDSGKKLEISLYTSVKDVIGEDVYRLDFAVARASGLPSKPKKTHKKATKHEAPKEYSQKHVKSLVKRLAGLDFSETFNGGQDITDGMKEKHETEKTKKMKELQKILSKKGKDGPNEAGVLVQKEIDRLKTSQSHKNPESVPTPVLASASVFPAAKSGSKMVSRYPPAPVATTQKAAKPQKPAASAIPRVQDISRSRMSLTYF